MTQIFERKKKSLTSDFFKVWKYGARVENKCVLLTLHYCKTPVHFRPEANRLITSHGFRVGAAHCAIETWPPVQWNEGHASIYLLCTVSLDLTGLKESTLYICQWWYDWWKCHVGILSENILPMQNVYN